MDTPVYDFIKNYSDSGTVRLHVPGHKGKDDTLLSKFDITEIQGADVLYHGDGIICESQNNASRIFGTRKTLYSTEGSSLCIRGMLALVKMYALKNGNKPVVAAGRNAHKVFMTASALLGIKIQWIFSENENALVSADISPDYLDKFLSECTEKPTAVYITSPDYLGNIADIRGLATVCRKHGVLLVCDNAHGSYLRFLWDDLHPVSLGADMCCDSAHKTLPVLTGGAYIHISENAPDCLSDYTEKAMSLFASTSPSYLTLVSLDRFNRECRVSYINDVRKTAEILFKLKRDLIDAGYELVGNEPLKLTLSAKSYGYTGNEIADILRNSGFECEFSDPDFVVMMFTPCTKADEINRLGNVLLSTEKKERIIGRIPPLPRLTAAVTPEKAMFLPSVDIPVENAAGRILAAPSVSCPPAVPVAICGEILNEDAVECFRYYGIEKINVLE